MPANEIYLNFRIPENPGYGGSLCARKIYALYLIIYIQTQENLFAWKKVLSRHYKIFSRVFSNL